MAIIERLIKPRTTRSRVSQLPGTATDGRYELRFPERELQDTPQASIGLDARSLSSILGLDLP